MPFLLVPERGDGGRRRGDDGPLRGLLQRDGLRGPAADPRRSDGERVAVEVGGERGREGIAVGVTVTVVAGAPGVWVPLAGLTVYGEGFFPSAAFQVNGAVPVLLIVNDCALVACPQGTDAKSSVFFEIERTPLTPVPVRWIGPMGALQRTVPVAVVTVTEPLAAPSAVGLYVALPASGEPPTVNVVAVAGLTPKGAPEPAR